MSDQQPTSGAVTQAPQQPDQESGKVKKKDPRNRVTPDAFTVSDKVLGMPLATPKRRAFAIFIDLLVIQQLSHIGSMVLGLSIASMLLVLASNRKQKVVGKKMGQIVRYIGIGVILAVIANEVWLYQTNHKVTLLRDQVLEDSFQLDESLPLETQLNKAMQHIEALEEQDTDLLELVDQMAEQFGYGFGWAAVYFTLCLYLTNGQTLGKWLCRIRVVQLDGKPIGIWAALGRYGGYAASFVTGLSGFFQIYWDANRQGLHDKVSGTVVVCLRRQPSALTNKSK